MARTASRFLVPGVVSFMLGAWFPAFWVIGIALVIVGLVFSWEIFSR